MTSTGVIMTVFSRLFPDIHAHKIFARAQPLIPPLVAGALLFIPGGYLDPREHVMSALVLGACSGWAYKALRQVLMGHDSRIGS